MFKIFYDFSFNNCNSKHEKESKHAFNIVGGIKHIEEDCLDNRVDYHSVFVMEIRNLSTFEGSESFILTFPGDNVITKKLSWKIRIDIFVFRCYNWIFRSANFLVMPKNMEYLIMSINHSHEINYT